MPRISQAVAQVYRDTLRCLGELRPLALIVLLIALAFQIAETLLLPGDGDISRDLLLRFLSNLAQGFLTVPYYIAVHRLVILGERTTSYVLAPSHPRFQLFFWWWAALTVVIYLPISLADMLSPSRGATSLSHLVALAGLPILLIAIIIVMLRLTIIFPAVAVDAPGATWRNVMADTKGYAWRIFLLDVVAYLPLLIAAFGLMALFGSGTSGRSWVGNALIVAIVAVLGVIGQTLFIVIASRLYLWIGNRTKRV